VVLPVTEGSDIRFIQTPLGAEPLHTRVHGIIQDQQGFLWFATQTKLLRYDGYDVREYPRGENPGKAVKQIGPDVFTRALAEDKSGKLWVASDLGIGIVRSRYGFLDEYDPVTETFTRHVPEGGQFDGPITNITQDRDGVLWLASNHGLIRMDQATGRMIHYRHRAEDPASLSGDFVRSTLEARDGTFWVATTKGVDQFDRRTAKAVRHVLLPVDLRDEVQISLFEDRSGVVWTISGLGYGLARLDRQAGRLIPYSPEGGGGDDKNHWGASAIIEDEEGALWIGTGSHGILKLNRDRSRFTHYQNNPSDPESLSGDQILTLFEDREGTIWVGTNDGGLNRFASRSTPFKRYRHEPGNPNSLDTAYTTAVYEDSHGILWIGGKDAVGRMDRKTGRMTFYRKGGGPGELSSTLIFSIVEDPAGNLWFGTRRSGLNRLDPGTGKFKVYRHDSADPHSLGNDTVNSLFVSREGVLWAGTDDGIDAFDPATQSFRNYRASGLSEMRVRDIAEDAQRNLWIATRASGLLLLDPVSGHFRIYQHDSQPGSLSSDQVSGVCVDRSGIVWAGALNGLNRFDPATQLFTTYDQSDGLTNSNVSRILEDERGDLWISTENGLSRFNPREKTFKNYYVSDGIAGNEFYNYASAFRSPSGEMFFSSYFGVTAFSPRDVIDRPYVPPVVLTDFRISGTSLSIGPKSPLKQAISFSDSVTLSHQQNILSLEFSALSYISPERNRFHYRLEPVETQWNESEGFQHSITYTLSPGEYLFRVRGSDSRATWNEKGASVRIVILPPWWSTWWFRSVETAFAMLALVCMYYFHVQNIQQQFNIRLEERVGERVRIARELHDTLLQTVQGLMLRLQVVDEMLPPGKAKEELEETLEVGDQAIIEGRNTVGDLRKPLATNDLARSVRTLGDELASGNNAAFRLVVEGPARELHPIVRDELYRIAREALRNAFAHAKAKHIEAEITYEDRLLRLRIRDDGEGIPTEILEEGRSGHFGLAGMRERAKQIGSKLTIWSGAGAGSEIEVSVAGSVAYSKPPARSRFWRSRKRFWGSPKKKVG